MNDLLYGIILMAVGLLLGASVGAGLWWVACCIGNVVLRAVETVAKK